MTAHILSIGDELLIGQVINSNQAFIAQRLNAVGIAVDRMTTVGDDISLIVRSFREAMAQADVVITTGGLGPTHDDVTRRAVCDFFETGLVRDEEAYQNVRRIFAHRGRPVLAVNEEQALVPQGCTVIQNAHGTAPGYFFSREGKIFAVLPGVPHEMEAMIENFIVPYFRAKSTGRAILHKTLLTTGIAESTLAHELGPIEDYFSASDGVSLAFLPSTLGVRLRISARAVSPDAAQVLLSRVEQAIRAKAEKYIFGTDAERLEEIVGKILKERKLTIAVAESCTGGLILDRLTDIPGSSDYVERGFVTYSNRSKIEQLGVRRETLDQAGAVSNEVAQAMATGARKTAGTDIGLSTTGIAGPGGATATKPVGTLWIGYADQDGAFAMKFLLETDRRRFKMRASQAALELLRRRLLKLD
jgi:nicotinamide-nucleotide amidase